MSNTKQAAYGLAIDVGNTKVHIQARDGNHELLFDRTVPTIDHDTLASVIENASGMTRAELGGPPQFAGAGFGGPMDPDTGRAKLSLVSKFSDSVTADQVSALLGGIPVALLNDVAASAHALVSKRIHLNYTSLTPEPVEHAGPYVLTEIGTGVGAACCLPDREAVIPSEAMRVHSSNGRPHGLNISGDEGFANLVATLSDDGVELPKEVEAARHDKRLLGPIVTRLVVHDDTSLFARKALGLYAQHLGDYFGLLQLTFLAGRIYIGGSVGRTPGWLERVVSRDGFWDAFAKQDALRGRDMPIFRVDDKDATVKGVYAAAISNFENDIAEHKSENDFSVV